MCINIIIIFFFFFVYYYYYYYYYYYCNGFLSAAGTKSPLIEDPYL